MNTTVPAKPRAMPVYLVRVGQWTQLVRAPSRASAYRAAIIHLGGTISVATKAELIEFLPVSGIIEADAEVQAELDV